MVLRPFDSRSGDRQAMVLSLAGDNNEFAVWHTTLVTWRKSAREPRGVDSPGQGSCASYRWVNGRFLVPGYPFPADYYFELLFNGSTEGGRSKLGREVAAASRWSMLGASSDGPETTRHLPLSPTLSLFLTLTFSLSQSHSHFLTLRVSYAHLLSDTLLLSLTGFHTLALSHSHTLTLSYSHTLTLSHSHTLSLFLSFSLSPNAGAEIIFKSPLRMSHPSSTRRAGT